jgi:predicted nucleic acid-binding protein
MSKIFIDTNLFLRHISGKPEDLARRATAFFEEIEKDAMSVETCDIVIFEVVYTLQKTYQFSKKEIQSAVLPLVELPGIKLSGKKHLREVFRLYIEKNIPFADAYFAVFMKRKKIDTIVSFDSDFDKVEGMKRIEP